jgi:hypothetical protein
VKGCEGHDRGLGFVARAEAWSWSCAGRSMSPETQAHNWNSWMSARGGG